MPRILLYYFLLVFLAHFIPRIADKPLTKNGVFGLNAVIPTWSYIIAMYLKLWLAQTVPALIIVGLGFGPAECYPYVLGPVGSSPM